MSPKNSLLHNVGLTALGWFGFVATSAADPGLPAPPGPAAAPPAATAPSPAPTVLSLYDGRVLQGMIQVDDSGYTVTQYGSVLPIRKELVEGAFGSLQEVYRYKADRLPAGDPDERKKLADWCLAHNLNAEAKAQLLAVLEQCPNSTDIKYRIASIDSVLERAALRDAGIKRTGGEQPGDGRPAELDPDVLHPGRGPAATMGLPVIFDLPTSQAVRRADEFTQSVHPLLQKHCARCHHENYQGDFQLILVKNRHQWTANVARANLEATLRMIDADSPSRSELLSRSLVPHGPSRRPIFRGANDPDYQRIAAWVNSLRARTPATAESAAASRFGGAEPAPSPADSQGFATDRVPPPTASPQPPTSQTDGRPQPPSMANELTFQPPGQFLKGSGAGMQPYAPPGTEFPVPYMAGGPRPKLEAEATPASLPPQGRGQRQVQAQAPATAGGTLPPLPTASPIPIPAAPASAPATSNVPGQAENAAPKPPRKPIKIDPALLERALMNRNAPR